MSTQLRRIAASRQPDRDEPADRPCQTLTAAEREQPPFALFEACARRHPQKIAIVGPSGALTYAELLEHSLRVARRLHRAFGAGLPPVVVLAAQGPSQVVGMLACLRMGRPCVPLDPRHSSLRHRQVMSISGAQAVLCEAETSNTAAEIAPEASILAIDDAVEAEGGALADMPASDAVASIIFTSGSTGAPKGVPHTQRSLLSSSATAIDLLRISQDDRLVVVGSLAVITSGSRLLAGALAGATLLALPNGIAVPALLDLCVRHGATLLSCYVGFARAIVGHPRASQALRQVRAVIVFGDVASWQDIAAMRSMLPPDAQLCVLYGTSESDMTTAWIVPRNMPQSGTRVPIGYPLPGADLWLDAWEDPAEDGSQVGELLAGGDRTAIGYWRNPDLTEAKFVLHPQGGTGRLYRTGDLVRVRPDGLLDYVGRQDNQVKIRGWRVELEEIETVARQVPEIAAAGVVPRRAADVVQSLAMHIVSAAGKKASPAAVAAHIRKALPGHMWPAEIRLVPRLPWTETGKLDRARLAEMDAQLRERPVGAGARRDIASDTWSDDLSRRIARVIASDLNAKALKPEDNFIDLGGDSLQALAAALNIEKTFGVTIDPMELLEGETIGAAVAKVAAMARAAAR